jgi:hypothetical protein
MALATTGKSLSLREMAVATTGKSTHFGTWPYTSAGIILKSSSPGFFQDNLRAAVPRRWKYFTLNGYHPDSEISNLFFLEN